jgi:hypothetical protein
MRVLPLRLRMRWCSAFTAARAGLAICYKLLSWFPTQSLALSCDSSSAAPRFFLPFVLPLQS